MTTATCPTGATIFLQIHDGTLTTISVGALSKALRGVHLPGCSNPTHAHFYMREHVPADLPATVADRSLIGGCMCLGAVRVICGPDDSGGWALRFDSFERMADHAEPKLQAPLWMGTSDTPTGTYRRIDGLAPAPAVLCVEKWSAE